MIYCKKNLPFQYLRGKTIVVAPRRQTVHLLNETGTFIWERIDGLASVEKIARDLSDAFSVDLGDALRDVETYCERLLEGAIIDGTDGEASGPHEEAPTAVPMDACGGDLLPDIQRMAYEDCIPFNAAIETTLTCNIKCLHCYNFDRDDKPPEGEGLTNAEIIDVIRQLRRAGTLFLTLTGGEIFARRDIFEIVDAADDEHMVVNLLTNGSLITSAVAERLSVHQNIWGASITIYGSCPEVHDAITRIQGSFDRSIAGIMALVAHGIAVSLKYVVMQGNEDDVAAMIALADRMTLPYTFDTLVTARHDFTAGTRDLRIDRQTLETLYRGPLRRVLPETIEIEDGQFDFMCNCARAMCAISAMGDIYPCVSVPMKSGNIREASFDRIWRTSPQFARIRSLREEDFKTCAPCKHKYYCRRDKGNAFTLSGDYTGVDPWVCEESDLIRSIVMENRS